MENEKREKERGCDRRKERSEEASKNSNANANSDSIWASIAPPVGGVGCRYLLLACRGITIVSLGLREAGWVGWVGWIKGYPAELGRYLRKEKQTAGIIHIY